VIAALEDIQTADSRMTVSVLDGTPEAVADQGGGAVEPLALDGVGPDLSAGALVLEERFSIVPEWVLDADVSDAAVRLYAVLRFGATSGQRMPSRWTLADRLRKKSVDSVDRALKELVAIGAVEVTRRSRDGLNLTNRYLVRSTRQGRQRLASGSGGGGRTDAARVAATVRPDRESSTENTPPPPRPSSTDTTGRVALQGARSGHVAGRTARRFQLLATLGLADLEDVAARCARLRADVGLPVGLCTADRLTDVLAVAVLDNGWPADAAVPALLAVAADPAARSPARLSCPGPWWDDSARRPVRGSAGRPRAGEDGASVADLEAVLVETGGLRVALQRQARAELAGEGIPLTRSSVIRRAVEIMRRDAQGVASVAATAMHDALEQPAPKACALVQPGGSID
jgi:hypothetical protein